MMDAIDLNEVLEHVVEQQELDLRNLFVEDGETRLDICMQLVALDAFLDAREPVEHCARSIASDASESALALKNSPTSF